MNPHISGELWEPGKFEIAWYRDGDAPMDIESVIVDRLSVILNQPLRLLGAQEA